MPSKNFYENLSKMGYPIFEKDHEDINSTLVEVAKSKDLRLWEGFPIMLANSIEKNWFDYKVALQEAKKKRVETTFNLLIALSLALFKYLDIRSPQINEFELFYEHKKKHDLINFLNKLNNNEELTLGDKKMSTERTLNTLKNYLNEKQVSHFRITEFLSDRDHFDLQYSLSKIFSPGQKLIIMKKLKGDKLTKIEQEYFSRVIKKKIRALANPELHKLANKLL